MIDQPLTQVLILLVASVVVVAIARRLGLPAILGYLFVGMAVGPHAPGSHCMGPPVGACGIIPATAAGRA
jgi:Kef-type K+ transport system membrane component KefB